MKPVAYYVLALAMAIPAVPIGVEIPSWLTFYHQTLAFQSDLRVSYTPGYMLRTGQREDIYDFAAIRRNQDERGLLMAPRLTYTPHLRRSFLCRFHSCPIAPHTSRGRE